MATEPDRKNKLQPVSNILLGQTKPDKSGSATVLCCPRCGSDEVRRLSLFVDKELLVMNFFCDKCAKPFWWDVFKPPGHVAVMTAVRTDDGEA